MEAAAVPQLPRDKPARIVEAMRASVAARGIAGSTFDHVARDAGVSRGLLHYYFGTKERLGVGAGRGEGQDPGGPRVARGFLHSSSGTKERLVVEVVRRECQIRGELLQQAVAGARGADELVARPVTRFEGGLGQ